MAVSKQFFGEFVWIIPFIDNANNASVDDHFRAVVAGLAGYIHRRPLAGYADFGRLEDGVLFCVERADAVPGSHAA